MKKQEKKVQSPIHVGNKVFLRTVTHYYTGKIIHLTRDEIVLDDAAWIADTNRFSAALASGEFGEVEPFHLPVSIGRGAIIDVTSWPHALPRTIK